MKRRILWINLALVAVLVAAGVGSYFLFFAPKTQASTGRTVSVQKGSVTETVTATGTVETSGTVELSFTTNGTIDKVLAKEGQKVRAGKTLATLDDSAAKQSIESARASYVQAVSGQTQSAQSLAQAQESVRQAEASAALNKKSYQTSIANAKSDLASARSDLADARSSWSAACLDPAATCPDQSAWAQLRAAEADVTSAQTAYDQAVQNASADETTNNLKVNQASVSLAKANATQNNDCSTYGSQSQQCTSAVSGVASAQQQYEMAVNSKSVAALQSQQSLVNADARITTANIALRKLQTSLVKEADDAVTAAEKALSSSEKALTSAEQTQQKGLLADRQSVEKAQQSVSSLAASATAVNTGAGSMTSSEASIAVARAGLTAAQKTLKQTTLTAPVAGTVASVVATKGAAAQAGTTMVTLIPHASYEVVASFSEADALKVKVGQAATVTFDALTDGTATGTVSAVDILPTTGNNVTTYGATITLSDVPDGLRQGMSASVVLTVDEATDVLWVPTAAITTAGGQSTVTIRKDGVESTVQVQTGLAGDSGTEITSGVAEGDRLVVSTSGTTGGAGGFPMGGIPGGGVAVFRGGGPAGGPPA